MPRVSDVMRGKIDEFTIDSLVNIPPKRGLDVFLRPLGRFSGSGELALPLGVHYLGAFA